MLRICAVLLAFAVLALANAAPASAGTWMTTGQPAIPPAGFLGFCIHHLPECRSQPGAAEPVELTDERRHDLDVVQADINGSIKPREDATHAWEYSTDGYGDCNKFALGKRRELVEHGWPRQSLLLATATTERGEGHLVLVVHTTKGDFVLDNRVNRVVDWTYLPYRWVSVQSPSSPVKWLSVLAQPINTADASHLAQPVSTTR